MQQVQTSQYSTLYQQCSGLYRQRNSLARLQKMDSLIESETTKQELRRLQMMRKLNKHKNKVTHFKSMKSIDCDFSSFMQKNAVLSGLKGYQNRTLASGKYNNVEDLFSFRPKENCPPWQNPANPKPFTGKTYLSDEETNIFQGHNDSYGYERRSSILNKESPFFMSSQSSAPFHSSLYDQNLAKLNQLKEERFLQQKQSKLGEQVLYEKIQKHQRINQNQNKLNLDGVYQQNIALNDLNEGSFDNSNKCNKSRKKNYICYSESEHQYSDANSDAENPNEEEQDSDYHGSFYSKPSTNQAFFKKNSQSNTFNHPSESISGGKKSESTFNNPHYKSDGFFESFINKKVSKTNVKGKCNDIMLDRQTNIKKQKILNKSKSKKSDPISEVEAQGYLRKVKSYLLQRSRSTPFISPILYSQQNSDQNQLIQRVRVDTNRQKQTRQRIVRKKHQNKLENKQIQN